MRTGTANALSQGVARKITLILAALLLPGGFIALIFAGLFKALQQSSRGRKVIALARQRVPAWATTPIRLPLFQARQAA